MPISSFVLSQNRSEKMYYEQRRSPINTEILLVAMAVFIVYFILPGEYPFKQKNHTTKIIASNTCIQLTKLEQKKVLQHKASIIKHSHLCSPEQLATSPGNSCWTGCVYIGKKYIMPITQIQPHLYIIGGCPVAQQEDTLIAPFKDLHEKVTLAYTHALKTQMIQRHFPIRITRELRCINKIQANDIP